MHMLYAWKYARAALLKVHSCGIYARRVSMKTVKHPIDLLKDWPFTSGTQTYHVFPHSRYSVYSTQLAQTQYYKIGQPFSILHVRKRG
jgi:hypothetical protein